MAESGTTPESRSTLRRLRRPSGRVLGLVAVAALLAVAAALVVPGTSAGNAKPVYRGYLAVLRARSQQLPAGGPPGGGSRRPPTARSGTRTSRTRIRTTTSGHSRSPSCTCEPGRSSYRRKAVDGIVDAIGTESGGRTLALGRNLVSYVIAADLVNLPAVRPECRRPVQVVASIRPYEVALRVHTGQHARAPAEQLGNARRCESRGDCRLPGRQGRARTRCAGVPRLAG